LISGTGFDWDNWDVAVKQRNKETKQARFMGFFPLPSEDRVEQNARLGYRLGKGVLAVVENRELSPRASWRSMDCQKW
jgi:hypothetical protein